MNLTHSTRTFINQKVYIYFLILFFPATLLCQTKIALVNCINKNPIEDVLIFTENGKYLGTSNKQGFCIIKNHYNKIILSGIGIVDTLVTFSPNKQICLILSHYQLKKFDFVSEKIDTKKYFLKLLDNSTDSMLQKDSTLYYSFIHEIAIPDSNWNEKIVGIIKLNANSYRHESQPKAYYCQLNYQIDDGFKKSTIYNYSPTKLMFFNTIRNDYLRSVRRRKLIKKYSKNITLLTKDSSGINFIMDFTRYLKKRGEKMKTKVFFNKKGIIIKYQFYTQNQKIQKGDKLVLLETLNYSSSYPKVIESAQMESIIKKDGVLFVKKFELQLLKAPLLNQACTNKPLFYYLNYQKMLNAQKSINSK